MKTSKKRSARFAKHLAVLGEDPNDIAGMRDLIAHEYFRIEMKLVLDTVERDLTPLEEAIDRLLATG